MSSGSRGVVGKAALVKADWDGAFGAFCGVLRLNQGTNATWPAHYHISPVYRREIERVVTGTNINNLSKATLCAVQVPHVSAEVQSDEALILDDVRIHKKSSLRHVVAAARSVAQFRTTVLAFACSGQLTADWREEHPDETVDELIEEISEKRALASGGRSKEPTTIAVSDLPDIPASWSCSPRRLQVAGMDGFAQAGAQRGARVRRGGLSGALHDRRSHRPAGRWRPTV
jgi:hypothetical protein